MFGELWFAVLPDSADGARAAAKLRGSAIKSVLHGSGRPWLLGNWPDAHLRLIEAGPRRLALLGRHSADAKALTSRLTRIGGIGDADRVTAALPGSFHAIVAMDRQIRVRGTASAARRVFHARVAGTTVAASRADVLASVLGSGVDGQVLALRLMSPAIAYPLEDRSVWQGVVGVPPDHCLVMRPDGTARTVRWWEPPPAELSMAKGAMAVRKALTEAVATCTAAGGTVSADMSGGLDSTTLCFLAARGPARIVTARWQGMDPGNDDEPWAARAAATLSGVEHVMIDRASTPLWFADLRGLRFPTEEPCPWVRDRAKLFDLTGRMSALGSRLHMCGGGGDELFTPLPAYLHDLVRRHPLAALKHVRRFRIDQRLTWPPLARALRDGRSFGRWLAGAADRLTAPVSPRDAMCVSWQPEPRMPPWATPAAVDTVRALLRDAAVRAPRPLSPERGLHLALQCVRAGGDAVRQIDQALSGLGIDYAAPYTDDAVVAAALSVRLRERTARTRYKPLLAAAMRDIVPSQVLRRTTKGEYSADVHAGLRRHRGELLELFDDSLLARRGLIEPGAIGAALRPRAEAAGLDSLLMTLGCEIWLRSLPAPVRDPSLATVKGT